MDVAAEVGMWFRDLEARVHSHWDLLLYLAHHKLRHPPADAPAEEDDPDLRAQHAEARALLSH